MVNIGNVHKMCNMGRMGNIHRMGKIYVIGLGPGKIEGMTLEAITAIEASDVIVGYSVYIELIKDRFSDKEYISSGMRQEIQRCDMCAKLANEGKIVSLICSGDAGVYAMASPLLERIGEGSDIEVNVIPGVTAALSGSAVVGAAVAHDFCVISLSDLLTPWELIAKRLRCAAMGDFVISIYNPSSNHRPDYLMKACDILLEEISGDTVCAYVENIGRDNENYHIVNLRQLRDTKVNMFTTVFIGNSRTKVINGRMVTPRGYIEK